MLGLVRTFYIYPGLSTAKQQKFHKNQILETLNVLQLPYFNPSVSLLSVSVYVSLCMSAFEKRVVLK